MFILNISYFKKKNSYLEATYTMVFSPEYWPIVITNLESYA